MPSCVRVWAGSVVRSTPPRRVWPWPGRKSLAMTLNSVRVPAPLGPRHIGGRDRAGICRSVECPGKSGEQAGYDERGQFVSCGVVTKAAHARLVLADADQGPPERRLYDAPQDPEAADQRQQGGDIE